MTKYKNYFLGTKCALTGQTSEKNTRRPDKLTSCFRRLQHSNQILAHGVMVALERKLPWNSLKLHHTTGRQHYLQISCLVTGQTKTRGTRSLLGN